MSVAVLKNQIKEKVEAARAISAKAEAEGRDFSDAERVEIKAHFDAAQELKSKVTAMDADAKMMSELNALGLEHGQLAESAIAQAAKGRALSMGGKYTEAEAVKSYFDNLNPSGGYLSKDARVQAPAVQYGGIKDILATGGGATGLGNLVNNDRLGLIDTGRFERPLTFRDLVTGGTTGSDTIDFVREISRTNNAAPVAEAIGAEPYVSGTGQVQGLKPQSTLVLAPDSTSVKTIAHWVPATKRALSDAAQLRTYIDEFLRYGLEEELEDQMVSGSGSGENFKGILNTSGITAQGYDTDILTTARKGKTKVRTVGRAIATAFVFNPADNEMFDLAKNSNGDFYFGGPTGNQVQTLWGLPRVESEAVPAGTGLVADFRRAILWDREQAAVQVSDSHADFFVRNLVAILAELRAAFTVIRPSAFVTLDLTA